MVFAMLLCQSDVEAFQAAVAKAVPIIEKSGAVFREERQCFSCHHQAMPIFALSLVRERAWAPVDAANFQAQLAYTLESLDRGRKGYREGKGQGGKGATASYALWTLEIGDRKPDETTAAVAHYLTELDRDRGHWPIPNSRPPSEASSFTTTALVIRALQVYGEAERAAPRIEAARRWLVSTPAKDTEDRVFRLWGLRYAAAPEEAIEAAAKELRESQREDGGWAQVEARPSDAYATGSALVALRRFGGLKASDDAFRRGAAFLLRTQREDGSWLVETRSRPIQKYFESGFPHGKHQFISIAGTCWAVAALCLASEP